MPEYLAYCMSKCATTSLADGLRRQYFTNGLRVCTIEPGAYRTALVNHLRMEESFDRDLDLLPDRVRKRVNDKVACLLQAQCRHPPFDVHEGRASGGGRRDEDGHPRETTSCFLLSRSYHAQCGSMAAQRDTSRVGRRSDGRGS
nr:uncharacterized protein LOC119165720 [Rhipicephalus microplus]